MIKICSLDFLNKKKFDLDIVTKDGTPLISEGDNVTPGVILSLYFKETYSAKEYEANKAKELFESTIDESLEELPEMESSRKLFSAEFTVEERKEFMGQRRVQQAQQALTLIEELNTREDYKPNLATAKVISSIISNKPPKNLEFDKAHAKRVKLYAFKIAQMLGFSEKKTKELGQAAYYHDIGSVKFTEVDAEKPGFAKLLAEESYKCLSKEIRLPERIAEVAKSHINNYDCNKFPLDNKDPSNIPYAHIVAVANHYDMLLENAKSKEEALRKLAQLGGSKFNIFVLHKFINLMRTTDE